MYTSLIILGLCSLFAVSLTCRPDQFQCDNGKCIYEGWVCDSENDCGDWSEESERACPCADNETRCQIPKPPPGEYGPPGGCIPPEYVCDADGIWDCPDGSDEVNCTTRATHSISHVNTAKSIKTRNNKVGKENIAKHNIY